MSKLSRTQFLVMLFIAAFALRSAAVVLIRDIHAGPGLEFGADGQEFNILALNLMDGDGFQLHGRATSFRAPGFPMALSLVYTVCGDSPPAAYAFFCLLGALSCLLIYALVRDVSRSESLGRWAGVITAIYVPHIYFATVFASENLFIPLLAAGLWCFVKSLQSTSFSMMLLSGVLLGLTALTRPLALLMLPLLALMVLSKAPLRWPAALGYAASMCLMAALVLSPWIVRNHAVHGRFVLVATNGGSTFYGSNNDIVVDDPVYRGGWIATNFLPGRDQVEAAPDEVTHDKLEWALGTQWVREHLSTMPRLLCYKLARFCLPEVDSPNRRYVILQLAGCTPFLLLMAVGLMRVWRREYRSMEWMTLHVATLATLGTALIFWGSPRFRDASLAPMMAYAALGAQAVVSWASLRIERRRSVRMPALSSAE